MAEWGELAAIVVTMGLVLFAAALVTPKGRVPLALRGINKILRRDRGAAPQGAPEKVALWRKLLATVLVLIAFLIAAA